MLRPVFHRHRGVSKKNVTLILKCGHVQTRVHEPGKLLARVHCAMCEFLEKERSADEQRRLAKKKRREKKEAKHRAKLMAKIKLKLETKWRQRKKLVVRLRRKRT